MERFPEGFPHSETEDELQKLLLEALEDDDPGLEMGSEEWKRFRKELELPTLGKLAS